MPPKPPASEITSIFYIQTPLSENPGSAPVGYKIKFGCIAMCSLVMRPCSSDFLIMYIFHIDITVCTHGMTNTI